MYPDRDSNYQVTMLFQVCDCDKLKRTCGLDLLAHYLLSSSTLINEPNSIDVQQFVTKTTKFNNRRIFL